MLYLKLVGIPLLTKITTTNKINFYNCGENDAADQENWEVGSYVEVVPFFYAISEEK